VNLDVAGAAVGARSGADGSGEKIDAVALLGTGAVSGSAP
jgi:hypothetical protein